MSQHSSRICSEDQPTQVAEMVPAAHGGSINPPREEQVASHAMPRHAMPQRFAPSHPRGPIPAATNRPLITGPTGTGRARRSCIPALLGFHVLTCLRQAPSEPPSTRDIPCLPQHLRRSKAQLTQPSGNRNPYPRVGPGQSAFSKTQARLVSQRRRPGKCLPVGESVQLENSMNPAYSRQKMKRRVIRTSLTLRHISCRSHVWGKAGATREGH